MISPIEKETLVSMLGQVLLDEKGVERVIAVARDKLGSTLTNYMVSTDLRPYLEFNTPKGNALDFADAVNVKLLRELSGPSVPPLRNVPAEEMDASKTLVLLGRGDECGGNVCLSKKIEHQLSFISSLRADRLSKSGNREIVRFVDPR